MNLSLSLARSLALISQEIVAAAGKIFLDEWLLKAFMKRMIVTYACVEEKDQISRQHPPSLDDMMS